ncbi:MAG: ribosome biogenesis GTPase YlqF [Shewanellaceae bacterium]|nr:ribosome biogenesis GTPase YlqF [Shewanellaceae bacterium]
MAIHWYPGHMHKAQKQIAEVIAKIDVVIEVLDARIPFSSENPLIATLRGQKPCVKVLNKVDLADPEVTQQWVQRLERSQGVKALPITTHEPDQVKQIVDVCKQLVPHRQEVHQPIRAMIMGIPNVGKSTIINKLANRQIAKTGNEPAVTKAQQRIKINDGFVLSDTPGILWPKVEHKPSSYRLGITGAIRDTAMEYEDVALFALEYLMANYLKQLNTRYQLAIQADDDLYETFVQIGQARGAVKKGHRVNDHKVAELLLHEIRSGKLGRLSFESPTLVDTELAATEA